jgi:predicted Fe-Mo cluster-binding NifX family protein
MKIAVTAQGSDPDSKVDARFGRAYWILFHDEADDSWDALENSGARNAMQGAGIQAAQQVSDRQAGVLITGVTGPKAFKALEAAGIRVMHGASGTVREALQAYHRGRLTEASAETAVGAR